jgi:hypothetical protein
VSASFNGWTRRKDVHLVGFPKTDRALDVVDVAWAARMAKMPRASPSDMKRGYWVNVAQQVHRRPWGGPGCLTAGGVWYSFEHDCCLDGTDTLRLQGAPNNFVTRGLSSSQLKDLAGEAFFVGSAGTCIAALYLCPYGPWWRADVP